MSRLEYEMSMTRTDALTALAKGLQKFEGATAGQVLGSGWAGLKGLHPKDLSFFRTHADQTVTAVASACQDRGLANPSPGVTNATTCVARKYITVTVYGREYRALLIASHGRGSVDVQLPSGRCLRVSGLKVKG